MKSNFKRPSVWMPLIIVVCLCAGLFIGSRFLSHRVTPQSNAYGKLEAIMELIENNYVDSVGLDSILEKTLPELLAQLDPHSCYIPASELELYNEDIEGSFSGIGIRFNLLTDTITVDEVISGGPSEKVGIIAGDRIVTVNDSTVTGKTWTNERIIKALRGPRDTTVKLGVKRDNAQKLLEFVVTRGDIPVSSVDACYMIDDAIGYLKISKFSVETYKEFLTSLVQLRSQGAKKFIIDLRGNGGGSMQAAVSMANEFLDVNANIVSMRGRTEQYNAIINSDGLGSFKSEDLVVIIDEISASASEIFAGAIQDNDRGLIVGRRSFGKGLVQNQIDLPDKSAIRLTVARYYTPSGRCIQKNYTPGDLSSYANELSDRYLHGEGFNADSMRIDKSQIFFTVNGREVYGGGGIIPDVYVPNDTLGITEYYIRAANAGMLQKFSFSYADANRKSLSSCITADEVLQKLPSDDVMLNDFVNYCSRTGKIAPRWYYINQSRDLIVSILKALIARDVLGLSAYYEVINRSDITIKKALETLHAGDQ